MNRLLTVSLSAMMIVLPGITANAGTVSGRVRLATVPAATGSVPMGEKEPVVIWLEGQEESKPPQTPVRMSQRNLQFSPNFAVAVKGQRVDMPNDDDVAHNVFSFTGMNQFNLGVYAKGEYRSVTFDKPGIVDLFCSIHRQMHARVFVVPTRYFANVVPGQSFDISDIPAGKYVLKVWHERSHMIEKSVVVPRAGTVTENIVLENSPQPATTASK
ncbi:MAG: cupredoxin domain-containing protein [Candidatus Angelobacter sp.]